ncbi:MAG: hypothetical protein ACYDA3_03720 [Gaiellaceae bacterium]
MRPVVIAFVLGTAAVGIVASVAGFAIGVAAQSGGWASFRAALGPVVFLSFERAPQATTTTFGSGLPLLALAGGALNAFGAGALSRRRG